MAEGIKFDIRAENKSAKAFRAIKSDLGSITSKLGGMKTALVGLVGVSAFSVMAKSAMNTADKIHKLNLRLGVGVEALSQYRHVADLSGVSFETFTMGMQRMTRRVSEAAQGTGAAQDALAELNLYAEELTAMAPEDQFEAIAEALNQVESSSDKTRLAMKLFDSEGVALLQMMTQGKAGLQSMREEADKLGLTMTKAAVEDVAAANDALTRLGAVVQGNVEDIMVGLAPAIESAADSISNWYMANDELIKQNIGETFDRVKTVVTALWPRVKMVAKGVYDFADAIAWLGAKAVEVFENITGTGSAAGHASPPRITWNTGARPATAGAAAIAAAGGGAGFSAEEQALMQWGQGGSGGATIVNNFNQQMPRSEINNYVAEQARQAARQ